MTTIMTSESDYIDSYLKLTWEGGLVGGGGPRECETAPFAKVTAGRFKAESPPVRFRTRPHSGYQGDGDRRTAAFSPKVCRKKINKLKLAQPSLKKSTIRRATGGSIETSKGDGVTRNRHQVLIKSNKGI